MRPLLLAALMAGLAGPLAAQEAIPSGDLVIDDPTLAEGLEALPPDDLAATVEAENAAAQPQVDAATLADMQAALRAVSADLQALRAELLASGASGFAAAGGDSAIDRMNAMEAQIAELTDRTEQLSNRIKRIVADGSNRIGDVEFRLCEMDPSCDLGALMTAELGRQGGLIAPGAGEAMPRPRNSYVNAMPLPPMAEPAPGMPPPTEEEERELASANDLVIAGKWAEAIAVLDHLVSSHAGGPLTVDALYLRGIAQTSNLQPEAAAQSWLMAFSAAPDGPHAAASLMALSRVMGALDTPADACPYLAELIRRFPDAPEAAEAALAAEAAACPSAEGEGAD
ncbi:MAG: tol-pal system protein [Paracoccaceae bacterium]